MFQPFYCLGKSKVKAVPMRTDEWLEVQLHSFLTSGLEGGDWSDSNTERFTSGERAPGRRWLRVWVGPRKGASISEKGKNHDHWVAQNLPYSLHRLGYPGSYLLLVRMSDESASWTLRFTLKKNRNCWLHPYWQLYSARSYSRPTGLWQPK